MMFIFTNTVDEKDTTHFVRGMSGTVVCVEFENEVPTGDRRTVSSAHDSGCFNLTQRRRVLLWMRLDVHGMSGVSPMHEGVDRWFRRSNVASQQRSGCTTTVSDSCLVFVIPVGVVENGMA